jgi:hypothetical protein
MGVSMKIEELKVGDHVHVHAQVLGFEQGEVRLSREGASAFYVRPSAIVVKVDAPLKVGETVTFQDNFCEPYEATLLLIRGEDAVIESERWELEVVELRHLSRREVSNDQG